MHFIKLRDTFSWKISEIELFIIVQPFETNIFFFGSFDELKRHQRC